MAGDWLKFDSSLPEKPETMALTAAMHWDDTDLTVGKLMRLFRWFDQHTIDGNAVGVTSVLLDRVLGVSGFVQAVANVGWIVVSDAGLTLKNFDKHNGASAKSRAQTAKRVANHRASGEETSKSKSGNANSNAPSVTRALAREEKRREEKDIPRFADFWTSWPNTDRKSDKKRCREKWLSSKLEEQAGEILAHVASMKATRKWVEGFEPAPLRYLTGEHWRDGVVVRLDDRFAGAI